MSHTIVIAGALANKAGNGGEAWVRLSWIRGFQQLGFDVWFVEQLDHPTPEQLAYFDAVTEAFELTGLAVLLTAEGVVRGPEKGLLATMAESATLVNISGHLDDPALFHRFRMRIYVDIDPGFTQSWHDAGIAGAKLDGHDRYATIGEGIGQSDCPIPTCGLEWIPVRQPVVLDDWPVVPLTGPPRFTTVGSWRGPFGPITIEGRTYGLKVHEFRSIIELPTIAAHDFELALDIHQGDAADRGSLIANGWQLVDPREVAVDPVRFRAYVQGSAAEFSVAQGVYVTTRSGWFSDRTVRYLASGRPALVQDTGFGRLLPTGDGLIGFRTLADAARGADDIVARYDEHAAAARRIAVEHFAAEVVLSRFCELCSIG